RWPCQKVEEDWTFLNQSRNALANSCGSYRNLDMIKKISYLGLGTMGSGMAFNLLKAGYELTVWNRSAEKCKPFARKGARVADSPADAVRDVDLVIYMLSNDQAVEDVVFGAKGILSGIKEGQVAMDMSTVLPATSLREQEAYAKRGVACLDAHVCGSTPECADAKPCI